MALSQGWLQRGQGELGMSFVRDMKHHHSHYGKVDVINV